MAMALEAFTTYPPIHYASKPPALPSDPEEARFVRKYEAAIGYRIFASMRWGQLGDGHISARDPILTDHFWMLGYGIPFHRATVDDLVLVSPDRQIVAGPTEGGVNHAGYNIHYPIFETKPWVVSAAHTHTPYGTPFSAEVRPFEPISQESCCFYGNQSIYMGEDLEVHSTDGGYRISEAMGTTRLCVLRNHGLLTGAESPAAAVGWFVVAERVAEVHIKAREAKPIGDIQAADVATRMGDPDLGWRMFQWLARDLVPDPSVVL
ncbi:MAG: class II aldolase/adducin family protein [Acidimicrobiales bacterium]